MKKAIPVIIAILLILLIGGGIFGKKLYDKFSYGKEEADLNEYFGVSGNELAIIVQNTTLEQKALEMNGHSYFDSETVNKYFNKGFYVDSVQDLILYTDAVATTKILVEDNGYTDQNGRHDTDIVLATRVGDKLYMSDKLLQMFTNMTIDLYDRHVQIYMRWDSKEVAKVKKDTQIRVQGGIKSKILCQLKAGSKVEVLETMDTWSKVKSPDSIIGYVENKMLIEHDTVKQERPSIYEAPEYQWIQHEGKVCLGWHSIAGTAGNDTLAEMIKGAKKLNVVAPTWFSLNNNQGGFRDFGSTAYVEKAHNSKLQVWGVLDDFNYANETGENISVYEVLSSTPAREKLVQDITIACVNYNLDGLNLDFEKLTSDCGPHFAQFLRELSLSLHNAGKILSVDNYVPFNYNEFYRLDVQGRCVDYVIIMGYDEHWHGSGEPGSVASIDYVVGGINRTLEKVPAGKIVNALPFYTILWKIQGVDVTDEYLTISNTPDFISKNGVQYTWDDTTCQNYAEWTKGETEYKIWFEDEESIAAKLSAMQTNQIAGVAVWRLGYGNASVWAKIAEYMDQ